MKAVESLTAAIPTAYTFGDLVVERENFRLLKSGQVQPIEPRAFDVLIFLIEHRDRVVEKQELFDEIWRQSFVTDSALAQEIKNIRQAIGDDANAPRYIETVRKHGYRFIADAQIVSTPTATGTAPARLVVLPFVNLGNDPAQEYLSDAMTDEVITELATFAPADLLVIARTTAMRYKSAPKDVTQICRELKTNYLIEGGLRHEDDHITITVQLIRPSDEMHLFARRYEADMRDIFSLRTEIAEAVAAQIGVAPDPNATGRRVKRKPTSDSAAYNLYLQGRFQIIKETPESFAKAKQCFEEATSRDPQFALAYDALAELYWYTGFAGVAPPKDVLTAGLLYAMRALEIDNTLAETHALLAMFRKELDYDWAEVKREFNSARKLDASSPLVRMRYAISGLMPEGRLAEAEHEIERALDLDPQSTFMRSWLTCMMWLGRRYDSAIEQALLTLEFDPTSYMSYMILGMVYRENGMFDEAIAAHRKAVEMSGGLPLTLGWLGLALGQAGKISEARAVLDQLQTIATGAYVPASSFAWTHIGLQEIDKAFTWMDRAVEERDPMMIPIKSYPFLDSLRRDPRYLALLKKMNYESPT